MAKLKEGDRVKIVQRTPTAEDRRSNHYFEHMGGLTGVVEQVYGPDDVSVKVDQSALAGVVLDVNKEAARRLRDRFANEAAEQAKAKFTPEELNFTPNYVLLVRSEDLEKV